MPDVTVGAPAPVWPAAVIPCCSKAPRPATCIAGILIGCPATPLARSISSILRSSTPGASLITDVLKDVPLDDAGAGADPPPPPPNILLTIDPIRLLSPFEYV